MYIFQFHSQFSQSWWVKGSSVLKGWEKVSTVNDKLFLLLILQMLLLFYFSSSPQAPRPRLVWVFFICSPIIQRMKRLYFFIFTHSCKFIRYTKQQEFFCLVRSTEIDFIYHHITHESLNKSTQCSFLSIFSCWEWTSEAENSFCSTHKPSNNFNRDWLEEFSTNNSSDYFER